MNGVDYTAGDRVRVISGPFEGFPGIVVGPSDWLIGRLNVAVDVFGRSSPVVLSPDELEPSHPQSDSS
jgi:transcription antitermination factor NusG